MRQLQDATNSTLRCAAPLSPGIAPVKLLRRLFCIAPLLCASQAFAGHANPAVLCHYTYGGEEKTLRATPVTTPYTVEPVAVGSYFLLKVVFQTVPADIAGIKIYVYADREPVPVPIQQVNFPYPPRAQKAGGYGFTGRHWAYEPVRDGEMQYWCELKTSAGHTGSTP